MALKAPKERTVQNLQLYMLQFTEMLNSFKESGAEPPPLALQTSMFEDEAKQYTCLLYTSPSPRDS